MRVGEELLVQRFQLPKNVLEKSVAVDRISYVVLGNPPGNPVAIARLQISAVLEAPIVVSAFTTNDADSALSFKKYCEKPPLLTSDSTCQMAVKTFCGKDCCSNASFPILVAADSDKLIRISFLVAVVTFAEMEWTAPINVHVFRRRVRHHGETPFPGT